MAQVKKIKIPDGDAFIEIGMDYVRIGTGEDTFLILDKKSINASAEAMNYQMMPDKVTYNSIFANPSIFKPTIPFAPIYDFDLTIINGIVNTAINSAIIASAVSIGI
jgi:hypothetical protein